MARPRKADRPVRREVYLPASLDEKIQVLLYSPLEGRVPQGAWSAFVETALRQLLTRHPAIKESL